MAWNFELKAAPEYETVQVALPDLTVVTAHTIYDTESGQEWYTSGGDSILVHPIAWSPLLTHPQKEQ